MKDKKILAMMLAGVLTLSACAGMGDNSSSADSSATNSQSASGNSSSNSSSIPQEQYVEAIRDPNFQNGFALKGNDSATDGVLPLGKLEYGNGNPVWEAGQWGSRYDFTEGTQTITDKMALVKDASKKLQINRTTSTLTLELMGSLEYDEMKDSRVMWAHIGIEQAFTDFTSYRLSDFKRLEASVDFSVKMANKGTIETKDPDGAFPAPKTLPAQFLQYFYVQNRNIESAGFGNFLWFGLGFLDTRHESLPLSYLQDHAGGVAGNYIYCLSAETVLGPGAFQIGKTYNVNIDILPHIQDALLKAQENGFMLNTAIEDCVITGMNIGWEVVGAWDVRSEIKNLSLKGFLNE